MTNLMSERARRLRRDKTQAERKLWSELRALNRQGSHFRQQAPIGPYIADFADHTARLVIELDGGHHGLAANETRDARRTKWLQANGYRVLRFWNNDVLSNTESVMTTIMIALGLLPTKEGAA